MASGALPQFLLLLALWPVSVLATYFLRRFLSS